MHLVFCHSLDAEKQSEENMLKKIKRGRLDKTHILIHIFLNSCSSLPEQLDVQNLSDLLIFFKNRGEIKNLHEENKHTEG